MFLLISAAIGILALLFLAQLLPVLGKRLSQVRFIRETLSRAGKSEDRRRVIVSLSTVPDRINNLGPAIRSLLRQTRPPDEIVLAIPEFSIREELTAGQGNTFIMVVDDDRVYPRDALESYLHYNAQLPEAALCFRGATMPRSMDWRDARMTYANELREPRRVAVITGCGSYLIQPRFFDESLWDYSSAPRGAFYMDDIWISGWLSRRGIERYVVPASVMMRKVLRQRRTLSLHDVPNGRQHHNNDVIAFFRDTWNVFASR